METVTYAGEIEGEEGFGGGRDRTFSLAVSLPSRRTNVWVGAACKNHCARGTSAAAGVKSFRGRP